MKRHGENRVESFGILEGESFLSLNRRRPLERSGQPVNNSFKLRLPNYASPSLFALGLGKLRQ